MWKLVIEDDEGKRTVVPLTRDAYTVGRNDGNTIRLTERNVSRAHARFIRRVTGGGSTPEKVVYVLEDLQSFNGVYVNGLRVAHTQELMHGDLVQIGDYRIVLQDDSIAEAQAATSSVSPDAKSTIPSGASARAAFMLERPNRLVMLVGPTPGSEFPLDQERLTIGRSEEANISINHNSVSRLHCEVHALGDGRFEIVDKGSSNGVRVNTTELKRGIIEPGDVIELGDVRFKFVGAGQIFRPGVTESQQLAPLGDQTAARLVPPQRSMGTALPYVIFALVVGVGTAGAWVYTRPRPEPAQAAPSVAAPVETPEQRALAEALELCRSGDCEAAHDRINAEIPESSPLRTSTEFHEIENAWADSVLQRVDAEPDLTKRRALLYRVAKTMAVDASRRKAANDKLEKLEELQATAHLPPVTSIASAASATTADAATVAVRMDAGHRAAPSGEGSASSSSAPPPSPSASASAKPAASASDVDKDRQLALQGDDAKLTLKKKLEPKVYGGKGTDDEVRLLLNICKDLHDPACVAQCRAILRERQQ